MKQWPLGLENLVVAASCAVVGCDNQSVRITSSANANVDSDGAPAREVWDAELESSLGPSLPAPSLSPVAIDKLEVALFGDVRPANPNDTAGYPDAILNAIFSGIQSQGISIAIDDGDHCFQSATESGSYCHDQFVNHFMLDYKSHYGGRLFPTMGNHEGCARYAATAGNCTTWTSGLVRDYIVDVVEPSTGQLSPYYSVPIHGPWGAAKFVHIAANAWIAAQSAWLQATLDVATTYTFVVRHEPSNDTRAPGVTPSESMLASHFAAGTLTLSITGHTHLVQLPGGIRPYSDRYAATKAYEVIVGNGGAPLDAGGYYGYAILRRRARDGAIVVQAYEAMDADGVTALRDTPDPDFRFAVNANGTPNANTSLP
jgi:hypothetical protein